jgi:hypothetical protein
MKNKAIAIIATTCMMTCMLTACGNKKVDTTPVTPPSESIQEETTQTINKSDINVENDVHEKYGDIQFVYGATSSKENIINGKPVAGDMVVLNGYQYTYNMVLADEHTKVKTEFNGWSVHSVDKTRTVADNIEEELFGIPVKSINYCYKGCEELKEVKSIPATVETAVGAFESCAKLEIVCNLPNTLTDTRNMFAFCVALKGVQNLPNGLKTTDKMFYYCVELVGEFNLPDTIETFDNMFGKTQKEITITGNKDVVETISRAQWNVIKK